MMRPISTLDSIFNNFQEEQAVENQQKFPSFSWKEMRPFNFESQSPDPVNWGVIVPTEQKATVEVPSRRSKIDPSIKPKNIRISKKNRRLKSCAKSCSGDILYYEGTHTKWYRKF